MTWLIPGISTAILASLLVALIFGYLYSQEKERALVVWASSWALYSLRFLILLGMVIKVLPPAMLIAQQGVSLASVVLLAYGTHIFLSRPFSFYWLYGAAACLLWTVVSHVMAFSFLAVHLPSSLFSGAAYAWTGYAILLSFKDGFVARWIAGWALILWGLHKVDYPFLRQVEWFAPWGFIIASVLFMTGGVGILLLYYERSRGRLQQEIKEKQGSETRFRKVIESSRDSIILADATGTIISANRGAAAMFGYKDGEMNGLPLVRLMPERYQQAHLEGMSRVLATNQSEYLGLTNKFEGLRKDGSEFPLELNVAYWRTDERSFFSAIIRDISERKIIEQELQESKERFQALAENTSDWLWEVDGEGRYIYASPKVTDFLGYSPEEIVGKKPYDFMPADEAERVSGIFVDLAGEKRPFINVVNINLHRDGHEVVLETSGVPVLDDAGALIGYRGIDRDITERVRAEKEVARSHALFQAVIEGATDAIFIKDLEGRYVMANEATLKALGKPLAEVIGKCDAELFSPKSGSIIEESDYMVLHHGKALLREEYLTTAHGETVWLTNKSPYRDSEGKIIGLIGISRNVTALKEADQAVRERERLLVDVFDSIQDGITVLDADMNILRVNHTMERMYPDMAPLVGKKCHIAYQGKEERCDFCPSLQALASGKLEKCEVDWIVAGKRKGTLELFAFPLRDEKGQVTGLVEYSRDITQLKKDQKERRKLEGQLRQAQKMEAIGTLAGGIAHDFNNILTPIIAYTEMVMEEMGADDSIHHDLGEVLRAANRAKDLVRQILTFSREREQELIPIDIAPTIKESLKLLKASLPSNIEIRMEIAPNPLVVLADPTQIHQVVMNLCTNAYHAMREIGGVLSVILKKKVIGVDDRFPDMKLSPGPYLEMTVADTGLGMKQEVLERIFEPYFTTKKLEEGTGLGLAVVHGIIKALGGDISVQSTVGQGATFRVYFPLLEREEAEQADTVAEPPPRGTESVLVVDDEQPIVEIMSRNLKNLGYRVTARTSSVEALECFRAKPDQFDMVITDQTMPNMTGDQLAYKLMHIRADIPVILCTGFSSVINEAQALKLGIRGFLLKPVTKRDIGFLVRKILDG